MLLFRVLFAVFIAAFLIFLVLGIMSMDVTLFVVAVLFAIASGLVVWEGKQRFHSIFRS